MLEIINETTLTWEDQTWTPDDGREVKFKSALLNGALLFDDAYVTPAETVGVSIVLSRWPRNYALEIIADIASHGVDIRETYAHTQRHRMWKMSHGELEAKGTDWWEEERERIKQFIHSKIVFDAVDSYSFDRNDYPF